jgi:hypothetical protein
VGVNVGVGVGVSVGVLVGVNVGVSIGVFVGVLVGPGVDVPVGRAVGGAGVFVGSACAYARPSPRSSGTPGTSVATRTVARTGTQAHPFPEAFLVAAVIPTLPCLPPVSPEPVSGY